MPVTINREPVKPVDTPIESVVLTSEGGMGYKLVANPIEGFSGHDLVIRAEVTEKSFVASSTAREFALGLIELCDQIDGAR